MVGVPSRPISFAFCRWKTSSSWYHRMIWHRCSPAKRHGTARPVAAMKRGGLVLVLVLLSACASFNPQEHATIGFLERAVTQSDGGVTVSVVALGPEETRRAFGVPALQRGIQPVWIRIENRASEAFVFAPIELDPLYYTPAEAAWINRQLFARQANEAMTTYFDEQAIRLTIPSGETVEGFVYVRPSLGSKFVNITLIGEGEPKEFFFAIDVPGLTLPEIDFDTIYGPDEIEEHTLADLRPALEALPCCTTDRDGRLEFDPLNFVLIGEEHNVRAALVAAGWDDSEVLTASSALATTGSFLARSEYRYSPFSALYAFGRPQDIGFQKSRFDVFERNHMRIWLTPKRADGRPVWVGAISRDIGIIRSGFLGTTHKIDPDVDAERWYLAQNLAQAQALRSWGYVGGGPVSTPDAPRTSKHPRNTFLSDGRRIVLVVPREPVPFDEIEVLDWIPIDEVDVETKSARRLP